MSNPPDQDRVLTLAEAEKVADASGIVAPYPTGWWAEMTRVNGQWYKRGVSHNWQPCGHEDHSAWFRVGIYCSISLPKGLTLDDILGPEKPPEPHHISCGCEECGYPPWKRGELPEPEMPVCEGYVVYKVEPGGYSGNLRFMDARIGEWVLISDARSRPGYVLVCYGYESPGIDQGTWWRYDAVVWCCGEYLRPKWIRFWKGEKDGREED